MNKDPIGEIDAFNLYEFCGNDPLTDLDAWGLAKLKETDGLTCAQNCLADCRTMIEWVNKQTRAKTLWGIPVLIGQGVVVLLCTKFGVLPALIVAGVFVVVDLYGVGAIMEQAQSRKCDAWWEYARCLNKCRWKWPKDEDLILDFWDITKPENPCK